MINQTPGLWDMIKPEAMAFMGQAMQRLNPDHFAQKRLQEMIQQNPMVLEQIANMDETQRQAFATQMGFRKQNPIAGIAPGEKRQTRERIASTRAAATPQQQAEGAAAEAGLPTEHFLNRRGVTEGQADTKAAQDNALFPVRLEAAVLDVKTGQMNFDKLKTELDRREKILERTPYGNLAQLARSVAFGRPVPNDVLERIQADPNLGPMYDDYLKGFSAERDNDFRISLMRIRNPQEKMIMIPMLEKTIDDVDRRIKELEGQTSGKNALYVMEPLFGGGPQKKSAIDSELEDRKRYKTDLENQRRKIFEENGLKFTPPNQADDLIAKYSRPPV